MHDTTFVAESVTAFVRVYHQRKVVFERGVEFFGPVEALRQARQEAENLAGFLRQHPDAETAPLPEGWTWRRLS